MIIDTLNNMPMYMTVHPGLQTAFHFLQLYMKDPKPAGRYVLDDDGMYASVETYATRLKQDQLFESHRTYMDVQFIVHGEELLGYSPVCQMCTESTYSEKDDIRWYSGDCSTWVKLQKQYFALVYPHESHLPGIVVGESQNVTKIVVKIPCLPSDRSV